MSKDTGKVFVYGTLKEGGYFAKRFDHVRIGSTPAFIKGTLLRTAGWFPGIILEGAGIVHGELHEYKEFTKVIAAMNRIEGYDPERLENSLYIKQEIEVEANGRKERAVVYTFNQDTEDCEIVEDGVWSLDEKEEDDEDYINS